MMGARFHTVVLSVSALNGTWMTQVRSNADLDDLENIVKKQLVLASPAAVEACKELITTVDSRLHEMGTPESSLKLRKWSAEALAQVRDSPDGREGMSSFKERRKPRWQS